jgi:hypothetical protein
MLFLFELEKWVTAATVDEPLLSGVRHVLVGVARSRCAEAGDASRLASGWPGWL